ncbi:MAG: TRAP transporter small permease subunit [Euzebya sp.]
MTADDPADDLPTNLDDSPPPEFPLWARFLNGFRVGVDQIAEAGGWLAARLVAVIFVIGILNVVLRYYGRESSQTLVSNLYIDSQWQIYAVVFLIGFPYAMKHQLNPRVDFWHVNYSKRRKAAIDLVLHTVLFLPFTILAIRLTWPFAATAMGRGFDGTWSTWRVWEIWETSASPDGLALGPVKFLMVVGFTLLALQTLAEMIRNLLILQGHDEVMVADFDPTIRVE